MAVKKSASKTAPKPARVETAATLAETSPMPAVADASSLSAFADASSLSAFADAAEKFCAQTDETLAAARDGFDAASERLRTAGVDALAHAREEMSDAVNLANQLAHAKSVADAMELQRAYVAKLFDARLERAKALTQASVEATRDAFAPFNKSLDAAFSFAPAFDRFFPFASK